MISAGHLSRHVRATCAASVRGKVRYGSLIIYGSDKLSRCYWNGRRGKRVQFCSLRPICLLHARKHRSLSLIAAASKYPLPVKSVTPSSHQLAVAQPAEEDRDTTRSIKSNQNPPATHKARRIASRASLLQRFTVGTGL